MLKVKQVVANEGLINFIFLIFMHISPVKKSNIVIWGMTK